MITNVTGSTNVYGRKKKVVIIIIILKLEKHAKRETFLSILYTIIGQGDLFGDLVAVTLAIVAAFPYFLLNLVFSFLDPVQTFFQLVLELSIRL